MKTLERWKLKEFFDELEGDFLGFWRSESDFLGFLEGYNGFSGVF